MQGPGLRARRHSYPDGVPHHMKCTISSALQRLALVTSLALAGAYFPGCEAPKAAPPAAPAPTQQPTTTAPAPAEVQPTSPDPNATDPIAAALASGAMAGIPAPAGETPAYGDWVVSLLPVEMKHLNPLNSLDAYARRIVGYVFDSLLERNPVTKALEPNVAESWEAAPDHLSYTFKIREGITFHDGKPLTAEDVKFTFDKMMEPKTDCPELRNYYQDITSCEITAPNTVKYTCKKPFFLHDIMLADLPILPKHIYGEGDINNHPNARQPIGSGPYRFGKWDTNQQVVLDRNKDYWGKALGREGHIDKIVYRIVLDDNASMQLALRGDLDTISMLPRQWTVEGQSPEFEERFNKVAFNGPSFWYMGWNQARPFFADKMVRRAMTMMLDRETIREKVLFGLANIISGDFPPGTPECNPNIQPWPFDPAAATKLLDDAGWTDHDSDGIRDKDGVPFKFEMLIASSTPEWEKFATILKEELGRNGVELNIRQLEWANLIDAVQKRNFDSMILGWAADPDPDMYQLWHSSQIDDGSNYCGFNNPEADKISEDYRVSFDRDYRTKLCHRFHEILHEEQPYTFLFAPKALVGVSKRIHNAVYYPMFRSHPNLHWYVPLELQKYK